MPVHPRASEIHCSAGAALNEPGEVEAVAIAEGVVEGVDVDGAAVAENVSVTLSIAQNCWARFSAEGTFVPQEDATQL
jgi:lipid-binding SYLF domain-containing protein